MATSSQQWLEGRREGRKAKGDERERERNSECAFMSPQHPRQINKPGEV